MSGCDCRGQKDCLGQKTNCLGQKTIGKKRAYADARKQGAVIGYGQFLTVAVNFLIVAAVLFLVVKAMNQLKRQEEEAPKPPEDPADVKLLTEIRDLLASARLGARVV